MAASAMLKLPEFWESAPETWFAQAEALFGLHGVEDDERKFWHVVTALSNRTASQVTRFVTSPPARDKYNALKDHLLKVYGLSQLERASRLLDINGLGERTPSQLMDVMLNLLGDEPPNSLFLVLFLRQLPAHVRTALGNSDVSDPRALAEEADRYFAATPRAAHEHLAPLQASPDFLSPTFDQRRPTDRRGNRQERFQRDGWCYYHARFVPGALLLRRGKRRSPPPVVAGAAGAPNQLLFVVDTLSGRKFLCDTGAQRSVVPAAPGEASVDTAGPALRSADEKPIRTYGLKTLNLRFGTQRFVWEFVVADVAFPLLGADFLCAHNLLVDILHGRLVDARTFFSIPGVRSKGEPVCLSSSLAEDNVFFRLLSEYPSLTRPTFSAVFSKHGVVHRIETTGAPVHARARRLDPAKLSVAKAEFDNMERLGIVRRSNSPWSSPLHIVPKHDGGWRPCGDYRRLNNITTPDWYPVPHVQDFSALLAGCVVFSKVDLVRGYHQVPVHPADVPKTAVVTPFGLFEFLRMPFGLKNAAQSFQRLMDSVLRDMPFVFVYLDDILIASKSVEVHVRHLRELFTRLAAHGLIVNPAKCVFGVPTIQFLGHLVNKDGVVPLPSKVEAITSFARPRSARELREFLGMVAYYHRFVRHAAHVMRPLYEALKGTSPNHVIAWSGELLSAFETTKAALGQATLLAHPLPEAPVALTTDASDFAVGAVYEQWVNGAWQPLAFFSRQLGPRERKYSAFDRELLALWLAVRHFRFLLEGRPFTAYTDHKPLTFSMSRSAEPWSARQQRQLSYISEFTTDIRHVSGKANVVADCLSRSFAGAVQLGLDFAAMAFDQAQDESVCAFKSSVSDLLLQRVPVGDTGVTLWCDVSTGVARPLVPARWRRKVFDAVHSLSHPGRKPSAKLVSQKFVWRGLKKDVLAWADSCVACQRAKVQCHVKAPLEPFVVPERRFDHINVDLVGPLPVSHGFTHVLTMVDRTTRWPEAVPLSSTTTADVARAFIGTWIARFGTPSDISLDRGAQFTSELWGAVADSLGVKLHRTSVYHPQANGLCERFHRSMKASLRACLSDGDWVDRLPWVLLGLRCAPKEDLHASSAELVYGQVLRVPADFLPTATAPWSAESQRADLLDFAHGFAPVQTSQHCVPECLLLDIGGRRELVSIDRVKPACVDSSLPLEVAQPPRRGRPPGLRRSVSPVSSEPVADAPSSSFSVPDVRGTRSPSVSGSAAPNQRSRRGRAIVPPSLHFKPGIVVQLCGTEKSTSVPTEDIASLEIEDLTDVGVDVNDLSSQLEHTLASLFLKMQTKLNISESALQEIIQEIGQIFQLSEPLMFSVVEEILRRHYPDLDSAVVKEVFAEFYRVASKNLKKEFYEALDHHTTRLIDLFKSKKGVAGQSINRLLQPINTQSTADDVAKEEKPDNDEVEKEEEEESQPPACKIPRKTPLEELFAEEEAESKLLQQSSMSIKKRAVIELNMYQEMPPAVLSQDPAAWRHYLSGTLTVTA
ncbi:uncharacterized protein LOC130917681 [Corythoichthys intestinalis]|uniref:uncharacterized protein LOC130917681 n=1 Tax=Corythoichthys intestinalis TaxID=161448 RepID=UPI0025A4CDFC|nr:uncharacterized protein LOC130917681 [Corythoichthys intestinalis]XP_061811930.1 uncharacterized protein LOC133602768 [Nerophis lumbriciformis]